MALFTFAVPADYLSEAKILVRLGRESVTLDPTATTSGQVVSISSRRETEIKSELEILKSRDLAEQVVDTIGPREFQGWLSRVTGFFSHPNPAMERDVAVRSLMKNWNIEADKDSNIITVSYEAKSPKLAHDVVEKLIGFYLKKHIAVHRTAGSHEFFKEQTDKLGKELEQNEKALAELKNKTGIASVKEQRSILLERMGELQKEITESDVEKRAALDKGKTMQEMIKLIPESIVMGNTKGFPNYAADGMRQKLYELQLKEQELLSKYTEKNFLVQEVKRQIKYAESLLKEETFTRTQVTNGINPVYQQLKQSLADNQATVAALHAKTESLGKHLANAKDDLKSMNDSELQLEMLQREKDIQEANYRNYSEKLEQARIDNALDMQKISNISVAQKATYPLTPISPRKGLNLALGIMMAGLGAVGLAFSAELADHSLKRPEDVEKRLKKPLLVAMPFFSADELPDETMKKQKLFLLIGARIQCGPVWQLEECCDTLCDQLLNSAPGVDPPHVIALTSSSSGEGVSTVASNLALALARRGNQRVLLVEANHFRPSVHKIFGIEITTGLTDVASGGPGTLMSINNPHLANLDVIQSGQGEISLSQLADSKEFAELLKLWKSKYSFVILDMPAIFKTHSTLRLASLADGVVLVVEAETVRYEVVERAKTQLAQAQANIMGIVLNKRKFHIPERIYHRL
ncbi:MAG: polysaccharide biosynthesis tyrosine autokinase [Desulfobaccales bacterium]